MKAWNHVSNSIRQITDKYVSTVHVLKNGYLAVGETNPYSIKIYNSTNGLLKHTLLGHTQTINAINILFNDYLVSGSSDNTIKVWDYKNEKLIYKLIKPIPGLGKAHF